MKEFIPCASWRCGILPRALSFGLIIVLAHATRGQSLLATNPNLADFSLFAEGKAAPIYIEAETPAPVRRASSDLAADVERVTGVKPAVVTAAEKLSGDVVLIGVLGHSPIIDRLALDGKLQTADLKGKWESYLIQVVEQPCPGIRRALVIAGSDPRGAIYGLYEISAAIGVSPWYWWADVPPIRRTRLAIAAGARHFGPPSVKYRGIFINDEDWGLQPWAARTHEPETGDIGPKTYARVFELLLRLKANLLWPAMHPSSRPFNAMPENRALAEAYGIVMGSSHAEPMLRNNVGEWKAPKNDYNYITNREGVLRYWEQRVRENGRFENIYTLGMRGIHDSNMIGPRTDAERIAALEQIFADQRDLLKKYAREGEAAPQMFCAYKEVLELYRGGLKVPGDVTIVWPDDNFGYIRNFASTEERNRPGGFGVYYHLSYLGAPLAYLWLAATPPGLIWEEMHKAYEHGADRIWVVNVGDIKPAEITTELFMQIGWDASRWNAGNLDNYLAEWATREFGADLAGEIAAVLSEYYRLNFARRPEHLQWWLPGEMPRESSLSPEDAAGRLQDFQALKEKTSAIEARLASDRRDAFFELVAYPVFGSSAANERFFHAEAYARLYNHDLLLARQHARLAREADQALSELTQRFNQTIAGGKWRYLINLEPADNQWRTMRIAPAVLPAESLAAAAVDLPVLPFRSNSEHTPPFSTRINLRPDDFTNNIPAAALAWFRLGGISRNGGMITVLPAKRVGDPGPAKVEAPAVDYTVDLPTAGSYRVTLSVLPTHPIVPNQFPRIAVSLGAAEVQTIVLKIPDGTPEWAQAVLDNSVSFTAIFSVDRPGRSRLRMQSVDTGFVVQQIGLERADARPLP